VEDRMVAHCWYIFKYAVAIQKSREERAKRWRFDKNSFIYVTKDQKKSSEGAVGFCRGHLETAFSLKPVCTTPRIVQNNAQPESRHAMSQESIAMRPFSNHRESAER
jgi:hypothetical protein